VTGEPQEGNAGKSTPLTIRLISILFWIVALGFAVLGAAGVLGLFTGAGADPIERGMSQARGVLNEAAAEPAAGTPTPAP
jgi:hypothetical protein